MNKYLVPPVYMKPALIRYIYDLIFDDPKPYADLDVSVVEILTNKLIAELGKDFTEELLDLLSGDPRMFTHHLLKYMENGRREHAIDLAECMSSYVYDHCAPVIKAIYEDIYEEYERDVRRALIEKYQKRMIVDPVNGELRII